MLFLIKTILAGNTSLPVGAACFIGRGEENTGLACYASLVMGMGLSDPLSDLRGYLAWLDEQGLLLRVDRELSPVLEIPCFLRQVMYADGPTVLFERVKGHPGWRVAGNVFQSPRVLSEVLGVSRLDELGEKLTSMLMPRFGPGLAEKIRGALNLMGLSKLLPKRVGKASFLENTLEASENPLSVLPAFKCWPLDGGRYLTYPMVITLDPITGTVNMGVYRIMIIDSSKAVVHWQIHKRGAAAYREAARKGEGRMPVAVAIGSDPATMLAAASPVPYPIDKLAFAGMLRGRGVEVYELENGIPVPANSEVVIQGHIRIGELAEEGPFGDHFGYYDKPLEKYPVMRVERVYYRSDPVYYGSVTGMPPLEDAVIGRAVERVFLPVIKLLLPEVRDIYFPPHGVFQGIMIVSIRKSYPGQAKKVMMALWGLGQTSLTKTIIVVDEDIDPQNINEVLWAIASNVEPGRDVLVITDAHTDALDPASKAPSYGGKLGIDATRKLPEENQGRPWPEKVKEDPTVLEKVRRLLEELGVRRGEA